MTYLNQVDALLATARDTLAHARRQAGNWPVCGSMLARALEQAASAVFMGWDDPCKPGVKMHQAFDRQLRPHIDQAAAEVITSVWQHEGKSYPLADVAQLLTACANIIDYLGNLARGHPLPGWQQRPVPDPVGWIGLDDQERHFLTSAMATAQQICPGIRLRLFGSRAAGTARPSSDYDILFIFPMGTNDDEQGQVIGTVTRSFQRHGLEIDASKCTTGDWHNPSEARWPLIDRIKHTGIEIPG